MASSVTVYRNTYSGEVRFEEELYESFDELLDEEGPITILGMDFDRSRVLKEIDPIAYRESFFAFTDGEWEEREVPWEVYVDNDNDGIVEYLNDHTED